MDKSEILRLLPYGENFLLVDEFFYKTDNNDNFGAAKKYFNNEHWAFDGHFKKYQILPGAILIEFCAQASTLLAIESLNIKPLDMESIRLIGVEKASFRREVRPNQTIEAVTRSQQNKTIKNILYYRTTNTIRVNQDVVANVVVTGAIKINNVI